MPQPFILSPETDRPDLSIAAPCDYDREDPRYHPDVNRLIRDSETLFAKARRWRDGRSSFADLRANPGLTITVAAAGIAFGALLTAGLAFVWSFFL